MVVDDAKAVWRLCSYTGEQKWPEHSHKGWQLLLFEKVSKIQAAVVREQAFAWLVAKRETQATHDC